MVPPVAAGAGTAGRCRRARRSYSREGSISIPRPGKRSAARRVFTGAPFLPRGRRPRSFAWIDQQRGEERRRSAGSSAGLRRRGRLRRRARCPADRRSARPRPSVEVPGFARPGHLCAATVPRAPAARAQAADAQRMRGDVRMNRSRALGRTVQKRARAAAIECRNLFGTMTCTIADDANRRRPCRRCATRCRSSRCAPARPSSRLRERSARAAAHHRDARRSRPPG